MTATGGSAEHGRALAGDREVAIVTAAASGIGRACAERLVRDYDCYLVDRDHVGLKAVAEQFGSSAFPVVLDVTQAEAVIDFVERVGRERQIDVLVSAVSLEIHGGLLDVEEAEVRDSFEATVVSAFRLIRACAESMIAAGDGRIVVISSLHATEPFRAAMTYNIVEAALRQLARTAAHELVRSRVTVNLVVPGWVDTPGERRWMSDDEIERAGSSLPLGRLALPSEIAEAVAFLASPRRATSRGRSSGSTGDSGFRSRPSRSIKMGHDAGLS